MAKGQVNSFQSAEREKFLISAISQGIPRIEILRKCSESWGVTPRQVETYYYRVLKKIKKHNEKHQNLLMSKLQTQYEQIYARSYANKDDMNCRLILNDMAKLFGSFEENNKDVKKIKVKPPKLD